MITYTKLWTLLNNRGMKKTDLRPIVSTATLAKLGKNEPVSINIIDKICAFLDCQPGDIMEYTDKAKIQQTAEEMDSAMQTMIETLKEKGISEEQLKSMLDQAWPVYLDKLLNNEHPISEMVNDIPPETNEKPQ